MQTIKKQVTHKSVHVICMLMPVVSIKQKREREKHLLPPLSLRINLETASVLSWFPTPTVCLSQPLDVAASMRHSNAPSMDDRTTAANHVA